MIESLSCVVSSHSDPTLPDKEWYSKSEGTLFCQRCRQINRSRYPAPIDVNLRYLPKGIAEGLVSRVGLSVFRRNLIKELEPHLHGYVLGKCYLRGKIVEDYVTLYHRHYIVLRGGKKSKYYTCQECGSVSSLTDPGIAYVLRKDLTDQLVYQEVNCMLYLADELVAQIDWSQWPDVRLVYIDVRDEPIDGQLLRGDTELESRS